MSEYFDERDRQDHGHRTSELFARLPSFLEKISSAVPGWRKRLAGIDASTITSSEALAHLPVLRKTELMEAQKAEPPFGGFVDEALLDGARYFMSPGPVWEPQGPGADPWHGARGLFAAGFRRGDVVMNALSYHMTPGGFILDEAARALGCRVYPGGIGNTEQQVEAAHVIQPVAYTGTPDFLKVILDKAEEMGRPLTCFEKAMVSGGALFPSMREEYRERGINVMQSYATADIGVIAYETQSDGALCEGMMCSEDMFVEIVRPGTGDPVPEGEVGEIVVTNFNPAYPLIRFGTGDMSKILSGPSPCGRTNQRIAGWMGRADQRTKVKGMFVDPKQIAEFVESNDGVEKARLTVTRENDRDHMVLDVVASRGAQLDQSDLESSLTAIVKLRGTVALVEQLPNDGKVIDDQRDYAS